jgi:TrmH family RNA methyltransferase
MTTPALAHLITSKDNATFKQLKRLALERQHYRKTGTFWIEGEHLCEAAMHKGVKAFRGVFSQSAWDKVDARIQGYAAQNVLLTDAMFEELSALESSKHFGFECEWVQAVDIQPAVMTLVLDRVQDAGNVGMMLRSAAAFGCAQVLALKGTVALWSPKVIRAGMGAHFGLHLLESLSVEDLAKLELKKLATSSHEGVFLHELMAQGALPNPCAWMMGHEGQGLSESLLSLADQRVRISQPNGQESLNVAAAASIFLYHSSLPRS